MKVVVGMSGGVDSSVTCILLKQQGYEVIGATMILNDSDEAIKSVMDAKKVCEKLNIEHHIFDFRNEFKNIVINDFISNYKKALTPNPCVICNKYIKFGLFYKEAMKLNADFIATGHYANIFNNKLIKSKSKEKDQTYFLWNINRDVLNHVLFPLGNYNSKDEIRKIALDNNLEVAIKKDSQDVCFIDKDYSDFLIKNMDKLPNKGNIVLSNGQLLGQHKGLIYYTIGQRKGLNISYKEPLYVIGFDTENNNLIVGTNDELFCDTLIVDNVNLLVDELPNQVYVKIRSRTKESLADITYIENKIKVKFKEKQRAITKGQSAVFYKDDVCLGGGIIQ